MTELWLQAQVCATCPCELNSEMVVVISGRSRIGLATARRPSPEGPRTSGRSSEFALNIAKLEENMAPSDDGNGLSPIIGQDKASVIRHEATDGDLTARQAALANGMTEELSDLVVNRPGLAPRGSADPTPSVGPQMRLR
jgi:hypothetical protein